MEIEFQEYKDRLFEIILGESYHDEFLNLINLLSKNGKSKNEIYNLFLEFHAEIQIDDRTKKSETVYDNLSDFMDGFTEWSKSLKILPNEPDL
ncbi:hypothetical protein BTO06_15885 [Tenacibaculum sp. SZ-18]|uniref:hypothetical protein n=1 Tax=Tenacibaculum sp. SZ-18 TaxID=754423 RepID=UPI000C2D1861|nr:hypothetical protein [Tenacibaculum sp. SZ-18]AUC16538.1 hypothetical protein BTO06_15885 [Tenacibaculum sp. SZ-18]